MIDRNEHAHRGTIAHDQSLCVSHVRIACRMRMCYAGRHASLPLIEHVEHMHEWNESNVRTKVCHVIRIYKCAAGGPACYATRIDVSPTHARRTWMTPRPEWAACMRRPAIRTCALEHSL